MKKKGTEENQVPTTGKDPMEQSEETIENDQKIVSDSSQLKANILGTTLTPPVPSPQRKLGLGVPKAASIILQLADRSLKHPYKIVKDMLINAGKFIFPADFIILNIEEANHMPIILGRPFLSTSRALLDFDANEIILRIEDKQQSFTMKNAIKQSSYFEYCQRVDHWKSYKGRPNEGEIIGKDSNENLILWRMKDEIRKCN
ncbi:uncharacterized protein LOC111377739 [Olea europaea var. sylvestris]|uniref:uncharacterized protein LOC111377739 n=1 Tax=Olea europaea var. sylvestris TaxID=158386 RepID=UPI000C1CFEAD|nr:uncharacterized protein LOC111377739 [Olea europaea var. sylvestris]